MAVSRLALDYFADTAPNGSTADASVQPFDLTHTIIVRNRDAVLGAYVAIAALGANLDSSAPYLGPGEALTWRICTVTQRAGGSFYTNATQALRIEGIGGTPLISVQYLNSSSAAPA